MRPQGHFHEKLSWLLDSSIRLPGGYRIGLDGFIGLIPGLGDFISGLLSSLVIIQAHQLGVPGSVLFRMVINVLIDTVLGSLPLLGDVFDFIWKANQRNSQLLAAYQQQPQPTRRRSVVDNLIFIFLILLALLVAIMLISWLLGLLWSRIHGS